MRWVIGVLALLFFLYLGGYQLGMKWPEITILILSLDLPVILIVWGLVRLFRRKRPSAEP